MLVVLVDDIDAAFRLGSLQGPCIVVLVIRNAVEGAVDGELLAVSVDEVEAVAVGNDSPDDGGIRVNDLVAIDGDIRTGLVIGADDLTGQGLVFCCVDDNDLVAIVQLVGQDEAFLSRATGLLIDDGDTALACEVLVLLATLPPRESTM